MPHLVPDDIGQRIAQDLFGNVDVADGRIGLGGLDEHPYAQELDHVVIHPHGGIDDLPAARIGPGRSHRILDRHRRIADTVIADVVRVEFRIVFGERKGADGILESDVLEHFVPLQDGIEKIRLPPLGEIVVYPEGDGLDGLHGLPSFERGGIGGFQTPPVHEPDVLARGIEVLDHVPLGEEEVDPGIGHPGMIDLFRQEQE